LPAVLCLAVAALPAWAQTDDEQTEDHAERDRLYMERMRRAHEKAKTPQATEEPDPAEQQRYLAFLDDLVRDRNYRAADGEHYRVQTDDPRVDPRAVVELLERFRAFFDETWSEHLPLEPYDERSRVYLFWSYHKYNQLLQSDFSRKLQRPKGHYGSAPDAVTLHSDSDAPGDLADTVIHEATHQLMDRRIRWANGAPPIWLAEGMACYYGYMLMDADAGFVHDRVGGKQTLLFREGKLPSPTQSEARLAWFRKTMKKLPDGGGTVYPPLLEEDDPEFFYGENADFNYAASWLLVHWLLEGDDGAHAQAFFDWIGKAAAGTVHGSYELGQAVGLERASDLDAAVVAWAKTLKVR